MRSRRVEVWGFLAILVAAGGIALATGAASPNRLGEVMRQAPLVSVQDRLKRLADANLKANHFLFADGTDGWTASPRLYDYSFAADTGITMVNYPSYFTAAQILDIAEKFISARNAAGEFPICLQKSGAAEVYYSAWDLLHHHATCDGAFYVPQMEYLYYQKTGNKSAFLKDAPAMKTALLAVPVNHANGLVQVLANDQWVPWGFQDMVRKTGDDLIGSVLYYQAATDIVLLYQSAGDKQNAALFSAQAGKIRSSLAELWDPVTGMFDAATAQNRQVDIEGSAYAVYVGAANTREVAAISAYLVDNYEELTTKGYMPENPVDWAQCYYIHGGACFFGPGQYDNGAWSVANGWIAFTLAKTKPALAVKFISDRKQYRPYAGILGLGRSQASSLRANNES